VKKLFILLIAAYMALLMGCGQEIDEIAKPAVEILTPAVEPTAPPLETAVPHLQLSMVAQDYPKVGGSVSLLPFSKALFKTVTGSDANIYYGITYEDNIYWTNRGYGLIHGDVDILLMYNPPEDFIQEAESAGIPLEMKEIARDALAFTVSGSNPVTTLTTGQVAGIYTGRVTDWSMVGGTAKDIALYNHIEDSATYEMVQKLAAAQTLAKSDFVQYPDEAIGYATYYYIRNMLRDPAIKTLDINGVACESATIRNNKYPLIMGIYAVIRKEESAGSPTRRLFNYITGQEGADLLEANGYVSTLGAAGSQAESYTPPPVSELIPGASVSAPVFPIEIKNKYGFIDMNGKEVITPQYDEANSIPLYNGRVAFTYGDGTPDFKTYHELPFYRAYKLEEDRTDLLNPFGDVIFSINQNAYFSFTEDGLISTSYYLDDSRSVFVLLDRNGNRLVPEGQAEEYAKKYAKQYYLDGKLYGGGFRVATLGPTLDDIGFLVIDVNGAELAEYKSKFAGFYNGAFYAYYNDPSDFAADFPDKSAQAGVAVKFAPDGTLLDYIDNLSYFEPIRNGIFGFAAGGVYTTREFLDMRDAPDYVNPDPPLGGVEKLYDWQYSPHIFGSIGLMDADFRVIANPKPSVWYDINLDATNVIAGIGDVWYLLNSNGERITWEPYSKVRPVEKYKPDGRMDLYFAELPDSSADIIDQNGKKLMNIPAEYDIDMGQWIFENGLVIPSYSGAIYLDAFKDGKAEPDEWVIPMMEDAQISVPDENYLINNGIKGFLYDLKNRCFILKDQNIYLELCYDAGGKAVFQASTDLYKGLTDETGKWIFRQSIFESLGNSD